jgi:hypothetical protein
MVHDRRVFGSTALIGFLVFGLMWVVHAAPAAANEVLTWNETAVKAVLAGDRAPSSARARSRWCRGRCTMP